MCRKINFLFSFNSNEQLIAQLINLSLTILLCTIVFLLQAFHFLKIIIKNLPKL